MLFWGHIFSYFHFEGCGRESGLAMETQKYFLGGKMFWLTFVILSNDENNRKYSLLSKEDDKCKFNLFICRFMSFPSAKAVQKLKRLIFTQTCGKPYRNACYAG